jgi:hypothetical protein
LLGLIVVFFLHRQYDELIKSAKHCRLRTVYKLTLSFLLPAATLTDNFDSGLSSANWGTFQTDAAGAPWTVAALISQGTLIISKPSDTDFGTDYVNLTAGVSSTFQLSGDFSIFVDFQLPTFPSAETSYNGWNWSSLKVTDSTSTDFRAINSFEINRGAGAFINSGAVETQGVQGYSQGATWININPTMDSTTQGKYGIIRHGSTYSAWLDRGNGSVLLGSIDRPEFTGSVYIQLFAGQITAYGRPHTTLDTRFDNLTITADSIIGIPEPCSLVLLGLGGLLLRRRNN